MQANSDARRSRCCSCNGVESGSYEDDEGVITVVCGVELMCGSGEGGVNTHYAGTSNIFTAVEATNSAAKNAASTGFDGGLLVFIVFGMVKALSSFY